MRAGDTPALFNDLLGEFREADLSIVNLECPLIRERNPIEKTGSVLGAPEETIRGISAAGIHVLNLANNHIMDHGPSGLENTLRICKQEAIECVGAGENLDAARKILIRKVNGIRVGILGLAEHEFSIATKTSAGANPLDVIDFVRNIEAARPDVDYLIVLLHGGNEHYPYPRPGLMKVCRFLVEQGASAVICQHSHCAGCYEMYRGAHIVYGQGNLLFDMHSRHKTWREGMLVVLEIHNEGQSHMELIPYVQSDSRPGVHRMGREAEGVFRSAIEERSRAILDDSFVEEQWGAFCRANESNYLGLLAGHGYFVRRLDRRIGILRHFRSRRALRVRLNLIQCESHREALISILSKK